MIDISKSFLQNVESEKNTFIITIDNTFNLANVAANSEIWVNQVIMCKNSGDIFKLREPRPTEY